MRQQTVKFKLVNFSVSLRTIGTLVLSICLIGLWLLGSQSAQPSPHAAIIDNDELLALAAESQPNPDIYASSLVKPGDPLFVGLKALQEGKDDIAVEVFGKMAEDGNTDAMLWYGLTNMGAGVYGTASAVEWINKAAQQGNPYAMRRLVPAGETLQNCEWYLDQYCDDAWADKAREAFQQRLQANPDDVLSRYAASMDADRAAEAAKQKYYAPMVSLAFDYGLAYEAGELSEADAAKVVALLKMAANDNFAPAMDMLAGTFYKVIGFEMANYYAKRAFHLGFNSLDAIIHVNRKEWLKGTNRDEMLVALSYIYAAEKYYRESNVDFRVIDRLNKSEEPVTDAEISVAREQAEKIISEITPVIYIDAIYDVEVYH
ncbi:sel1 repeat family protein [Shewanella algae]|uniref:sel1 repeat family protein n=1 Tax=Shewanella algae TaxID=38313 RepID=UPI001AAD5D69|nr:sel1 repeat family protein [Shewanella algae]MBO2673884.1 sel1 repeat family protein [Shewanella algae]